jgi:simple sugar transport system permease protein
LFDRFALVYIALFLVPATAFVLRHTTWGLHLRTVGESPHAADSAGVSVAAIRYQALMMPFVLTIVAMAFLSRNAPVPAALLTPFRKEER